MNRIHGLDLARSLAIVGMIIVNFKMVIGSEGEGWLLTSVNSLSGKAAALFVVLAGVGVALMTKKSYESFDLNAIKYDRIKLLKRSLLLFVIGLSYMTIWPADILHYYGLYIILTLLFISFSKRAILWSALLIVLAYPFLMWLLDYDIGWNFVTLDYQGFWSTKGFIRNLLFNGFHPVFPWSAFMLVGLWYGRHDLRDVQVVKGLLIKGLIGFGALLVLSKVLLYYTHSTDPFENEELSYILGLSPMPPLPIYMLAGSSLSVAIISFCILFAEKFEGSKCILYLASCGRMALTLYVAHVVLGMGLVYVFNDTVVGSYSMKTTFLYAIGFSLLCIAFSNLWLKYFKNGPLEWLFKKILG